VASGWHLHQSLVDTQGRPAMVRAAPAGHALDARQVLSDAGAHWLGGLLAHAPGMAALCAPSIPAYSRFHGSVMAPQALVWGRDNRGALMRVVGQPGDAGTRIENRIAEPAANPHLALASQVLAGLDGMQASAGARAGQRRSLCGAGTALARFAGSGSCSAAPGQRAAAGPGRDHGHGLPCRQAARAERHAQAQDTLAWERREYFSRQ
jgi:glutamine synthetase